MVAHLHDDVLRGNIGRRGIISIYEFAVWIGFHGHAAAIAVGGFVAINFAKIQRTDNLVERCFFRS